ncbi:PTS sugar transporter subunit IIB [Parolsenella catena]|uniref:PTS sugar transporter subunit IIB n=1 Tax=Parolsenella catena TaxID=2003188 RepID=UPI002E79B8A2|nr:PTS sugar transporter subunit IIB [Parolsenella catena]
MKIVASRVDERLVHGQIMTSWAKYLKLRRIVVVDDQVAKDEFMATVLGMSAPAGISIDILSVADAASRIQNDKSDENTMLLFKRISAALELAKLLAGTPNELKELNLGNLGSVPGRTQITKNIFLSDEEEDEVGELRGMGVNVFLQMLYTDAAVPSADVIG